MLVRVFSGETIVSEADLPMRPTRVPLRAEVTLRRRFDHRYTVNLLDISAAGCRVELVERVQPGDLLWVTLPGMTTIEATACWTEGFVAGVQFKHPLHPSVFEMLAARLDGRG